MSADRQHQHILTRETHELLAESQGPIILHPGVTGVAEAVQGLPVNKCILIDILVYPVE